jgi:hypothetical protein
MSIISVSLPADGSTADVADVNTPITTIVNEINGGLDNSNIASGAAIDTSKIAGATSSTLAAWQSYTPTFTNLTVGNGTLTCKYNQIGKTVIFKISLVFGSTTAISGSVSLTLPVTSVALVGSGAPLGAARLIDSTNLYFVGIAVPLTTTTMKVTWSGVSGSGQIETNLAASSPFGWATGDEIQINGTYEAA